MAEEAHVTFKRLAGLPGSTRVGEREVCLPCPTCGYPAFSIVLNRAGSKLLPYCALNECEVDVAQLLNRSSDAAKAAGAEPPSVPATAQTPAGGHPPASKGAQARDQSTHNRAAARLKLEADADEIRRTLQLFHQPGEVFEIRAIGGGLRQTHAGYFNDYDRAVEAVLGVSRQRPEGIYHNLNVADPALLGRAYNKLLPQTKRNAATSDEDIIRRRWMLLDFDAVRRVSGISSSEAEHAAALAAAKDTREKLRAKGWPEPVFGDSANGGHLLHEIDLPADDGGLIKRVLKGLAPLVTDPAVKLDEVVFNAARITKLFGTVARKGDSSPDRPHRLSHLLEVPSEIVAVPLSLLEAIAAPEENRKKPQAQDKARRERADIDDIKNALGCINADDRQTWLHVGMALHSELGEDGRTLWNTWSQASAKFNADNQDATWRGFDAGGGIGIGTLFKLAKDAGWSGPALGKKVESRAVAVVGGRRQVAPPALRPPQTPAAFLREYRKRVSAAPIVEGLLLAGTFNLLIGPPLHGKSTFGAAMARAIHLGVPFLGRKCTKLKVGYFALERSNQQVAEWFEKWGIAEDDICYEGLIDHPDPAAYIEARIRECGLQFVVIDHLQHAAPGITKGNDYANVAAGLRPFQRIVVQTGCCFLVLHHKKRPQADESLAGSGEEFDIKALGSRAYEAASDTLIECTRVVTTEDGVTQKKYFVRGETRGLDEFPRTRINIDLETGEVEMGDAWEEEVEKVTAAISKYLTAHPGSTEKEIKGKVRGKGVALNEALRKSGKFRREGAGGRQDPYRYFVKTREQDVPLVPDVPGPSSSRVWEQENKIDVDVEKTTRVLNFPQKVLVPELFKSVSAFGNKTPASGSLGPLVPSAGTEPHKEHEEQHPPHDRCDVKDCSWRGEFPEPEGAHPRDYHLVKTLNGTEQRPWPSADQKKERRF